MSRTPVIIGVGQASEIPGRRGYLASPPADLAAQAVRAALTDCRATGDVAAAVDTIAGIRQFEISTPFATAPFGRADNLPRAVAARVGAQPERAILSVTGGQANQALVGELAEEIAQGRSELAILFGAEAISTVRHLQSQGESRDWSETAPSGLEDRGYGIEGLFDTEMVRHGVAAPIPCYALLENARRARLGMTADAYRQQIGALFAPFTEVAARNPHAAAPVRRNAEELAAVTAQNRILAEPYTRLTVARDQVNQAACLILCSAERARALGVAEDGWVYIHASVEAAEPSPLRRADLGRSPAAIAATQKALELAGKQMADMDAIDFYSCFALPVFNLLDAFGLAPNDPRGFTLTGGLPFFGGAGNNYSMHAIAEAVTRLRGGYARWAIIGANGGFMSKYATGIYAREPADWSDPASRRVRLADQPAMRAVAKNSTGNAILETCTILPDQTGVIIAMQQESGARTVAVTAPGDAATLTVLRHGVPFGRNVRVGPDGVFRFS